MPIKQKLTRDADATIVDDENGTWFAVWNTTEGFDPFTAAIRATSRSAAEEVWFEQFPDRGAPETLHITECTLSVNVILEWPDGEVTPELADKSNDYAFRAFDPRTEEWVDLRTVDGEALEWWRQYAIEDGYEEVLDDVHEILFRRSRRGDWSADDTTIT